MTELNVDVESLLDATLDDLADLPAWKTFPEGTHRVLQFFELKFVNDKKGVEHKLQYIEPVELGDPMAEAPKKGDECSTLYMLDNEFGQGNLKKVLAVLIEHNGSPMTIRQAMEKYSGSEVIANTKQRKNKETGAVYLDIKSIAFE